MDIWRVILTKLINEKAVAEHELEAAINSNLPAVERQDIVSDLLDKYVMADLKVLKWQELKPVEDNLEE